MYLYKVIVIFALLSESMKLKWSKHFAACFQLSTEGLRCCISVTALHDYVLKKMRTIVVCRKHHSHKMHFNHYFLPFLYLSVLCADDVTVVVCNVLMLKD